MNEINKTLYIPLYGKSLVSKKGIILEDKKAEEIWEKEHFLLKRKSKSKWLAYFMAMRARVFDDWIKAQIRDYESTTVLHIGCGMDSRYLRVNLPVIFWYDVDLPEVIREREKYYSENQHYSMLEGNATTPNWLDNLPKTENAVIVLEGISMYMRTEEIQTLFSALANKYKSISILMDVYTTAAAKASRYKNPINDVGVIEVYGIDDPESVIKNNSVEFIAEHEMTPEKLVSELKGLDHSFFKVMFAGKIAGKLYRLFEYTSNKQQKH